jgi:hypothetical protein
MAELVDAIREWAKAPGVERISINHLRSGEVAAITWYSFIQVRILFPSPNKKNQNATTNSFLINTNSHHFNNSNTP